MRAAGYRIQAPESIGAAIRHYRKRSGLTQAELARRAGLNQTYVSDLEQGKNTEQLRRILRIFRQLGVTITLDADG